MDRDAIWANLARFDEINQARAKIRINDAQISKLQNECGSCSLWMTQQCPPEKRGDKVTCGRLKCAHFDMQKWVERFIEKLEQENVELASIVNPPKVAR